jgi:hypothetical protein
VVNGERREALLRRLELFRADAERNERAQQLGSMSYAYPQSPGEWLGTAVHWNELLLFHEYFHGDNGAGLGASHQTGWTGLVALLFARNVGAGTERQRRVVAA